MNHMGPGGSGPAAVDARAAEVVRTLLELVAAGHGDPRFLPSLRVHLDWIQYRANFREPILVRRAADRSGGPLALAELAVDLRRVDTAALSEALAQALGGVADAPESGPDGSAPLEAWTPVRDSVIWRFNRLFWQRVADWEAASGRRFEEALPSGRSDASHPEAVADSVADFWTLLRDLEKKGHLPPEIFALEIGVGSGQRAALWLDRFRSLDEERGTSYYPRLRFLLGDYSLPTLDRAMAAVAAHRDLVSVIALDALNPLKTLSFLRYKILSIHLTNVYDNLPHDEVVRRDGRLYLVETRGYVPRDAAARVAAIAGCPVGDLSQTIEQLLRVGPEALGDRARGVEFWR
ncbi:MAG TPA: hypothetical protein VLL75_10700, partial [Vicinamibacteria bacterium]|nr:hypothetical protein [Vicinamibacteria bacterium]